MEEETKPKQFLESNKIIWVILVSVVAIFVIVIVGLYVWKVQFSKEGVESTSQNNTEEGSSQVLREKSGEGMIYRIGNDLVLYNLDTKEKSIVLSSDNLLDFNLSRDKNFIAYSLKEVGFEENSDVYLKNLMGGETIRLTEKNDIASFNPKIFPKNDKVAYVRRVYNQATKELSDGEIWIIDIDGSVESSKKLFSSGEIRGLETEQDCASEEERKSVKIGIESISYDGDVVAYWKKDWAPECSGLWGMPYLSRLDGTDFFTDKLKQQNSFDFDIPAWDKKVFDWEMNEIFWFDDGSFVIGQDAPIPISGSSIYYFDKEQNNKWEIFDSFKQNADKYDTQVFINSMVKEDDDHFTIAYSTYKRLGDTKYFVDKFSLGDKIDIANLDDKKYFAIERLENRDDQILGVELIDDERLIYLKREGENNYSLYLYNLIDQKEEKIVGSDTLLEFEL